MKQYNELATMICFLLGSQVCRCLMFLANVQCFWKAVHYKCKGTVKVKCLEQKEMLLMLLNGAQVRVKTLIFPSSVRIKQLKTSSKCITI